MQLVTKREEGGYTNIRQKQTLNKKKKSVTRGKEGHDAVTT